MKGATIVLLVALCLGEADRQLGLLGCRAANSSRREPLMPTGAWQLFLGGSNV